MRLWVLHGFMIGNDFSLMFAVGLLLLTEQHPAILNLIEQDYYKFALVTFLATSFLLVYTRKYHRSFPRNLLFTPLPICGLGVIMWVQMVRFGMEKVAESDVPAVLFLMLTCALFTMVTWSPFFPYANRCWSLGTYLILMLLVQGGVVVKFSLLKDFRYIDTIIVSFLLLYIVLRLRVLVLYKGFNTATHQAIHAYLELIVMPMAVLVGPLTFFYFYMIPQNYET